MKKLILIIACILFFPLTLFAQDTMKFVYYNDFAPFSWEDSEKQMGNLGDITLNFFKMIRKCNQST